MGNLRSILSEDLELLEWNVGNFWSLNFCLGSVGQPSFPLSFSQSY